MKNYIQQGDTLYFPIEKIPTGLNPLETDVVQEGEATGHAHRLYGDGFKIFEEPKTKQKYLRIVHPTDLKHEEHHKITIPPGNYRVGIVREYNHWDEEARAVVD